MEHSPQSSSAHYMNFPYSDEDTGEYENEPGEKVEKNRERNREHAKRTRMRKKAILEGMKGRLVELQSEVRAPAILKAIIRSIYRG